MVERETQARDLEAKLRRAERELQRTLPNDKKYAGRSGKVTQLKAQINHLQRRAA